LPVPGLRQVGHLTGFDNINTMMAQIQ